MKETVYESPVNSVVLAWLLAGTADALAAMVVHGVKAMPMFRFIASGLFGTEALHGGMGMALAGMAFHYTIALAWTLVLYFMYPKLRLWRVNIFITAVVYGVVIWVVMNLVVLPLSEVRQAAFTVRSVAVGMAVLILAVGLPLSLVMNRHFSRTANRG